MDIVRGKPLSKDETKFLLELIEKNQIIVSKTTNATTNKMKAEQWLSLSQKFNATATLCPRMPQQLRLKWENLKKNARKRSTKIRMNRIQTGGGVPEYIPPDEILDKVLGMLGSTGSGFVVPFGGDKEPDAFSLYIDGGGGGDGDADGEDGSGVVDVSSVAEPRESVASTSAVNPGSCSSSQGPVIEVVESGTTTPNKLTMSMPRTGKRKLKINSTTKRNLAIADYYISKKKYIDANLENIQLQNENLRLENEKLKLEIKNAMQ